MQSSTDRVACVTVPQQQHQPYHTAGWGPRRRRRPPCNADPHDTFPVNNNRQEEMRTSCCQEPVLHSDMQQRCHHTSGSARSQSWQAMPRPSLHLAATARLIKVQLRIRGQSLPPVVLSDDWTASMQSGCVGGVTARYPIRKKQPKFSYPRV